MTTEVDNQETSTTSSEPEATTTGITTEPTTQEPEQTSEPTTPLAEAVVEPVADEPVADEPAEEVEDYDLELSEDSPLSQADLDAIAQEAGERGLNKEQADKLIKQKEDTYNNGFKAADERNNARLAEDNRKFNEDPEFSGDNKEGSFQAMSKAIANFGDEDLKAALNDPYIGNNLPLARFLKRIGEALGEDPIVNGSPAFKPDKGLTDEQKRLRQAYPEHFNQK